MKEAYNFYNSITSDERFILSSNFAEVLKYWYEPINVSTDIIPLSFEVELSISERIGQENMDTFINILNSTNPKKVIILSRMFGIDEKEINELI
jgi:hypothetical protein